MKGQVKEELSTTVVSSIWENGKVTILTDLVFIHGKTVLDTKGIL